MEENKDFSWTETKTATSNKLGRIVPIPPGPSDMTAKGISIPLDEGEEEDMVVDVARRRLDSATSRKLREE